MFEGSAKLVSDKLKLFPRCGDHYVAIRRRIWEFPDRKVYNEETVFITKPMTAEEAEEVGVCYARNHNINGGSRVVGVAMEAKSQDLAEFIRDFLRVFEDVKNFPSQYKSDQVALYQEGRNLFDNIRKED